MYIVYIYIADIVRLSLMKNNLRDLYTINELIVRLSNDNSLIMENHLRDWKIVQFYQTYPYQCIFNYL